MIELDWRNQRRKKKKRKIFYLAFTIFGMEQHQIMCNAAAVAVTQQLLLAGEETGQARGAWRAPADCQDAFHTRGLSAGTPEEETCKHSKEASFC